MKIDLFAHVCPQKFMDAFAKTKRGLTWDDISGDARIQGGAVLWDMEKRLEVMDRYEDYFQVLIPVAEVVEPFFGPKDTAYLCQSFNDAVAEIVVKYPKRFLGAVATLPMNNIDAALKEIDRTINKMGFKGVLLHTPVFCYEEGRPLEQGLNYETMKPLDSPEFMPIYETMSKHHLPIWIHPIGMGGVPFYRGEKRGKYILHHVFGWPVESAMAMGRLVCSGILAKFPNLRFIIHHCGSGIVPALGGRIDNEFDKFMAADLMDWGQPGAENPFRKKRAVDYFRMFYGDTALYGGVEGLDCGHAFFGSEHIVFGTDYPMDLSLGDKFIKKTIDAVHRMKVSDADKELIFAGNAKRILHLDI
jgi:aminocarboxymuconate-semialdehyde decarboxylase